MKIGTHDGAFHTDEVLAIATLLMVYPDAEIIRSRDPNVLATCDIRVDVGRKYDPKTGDFDHHQPEGAGKRKNGIKYSSFGLVWKEYGHRIMQDTEARQFIETIIVQSVDAHDNGQTLLKPAGDFGNVFPFNFSMAISSLNLYWDEPDELQEGQFKAAVAMGTTVLTRLIGRAHSTTRAKGLVKKAIANAKDERLIILDTACPWHEVVIKDAPKALFVLLPERGGKWNVQTIPQAIGSKTYRKSLPRAWKGLDGEAFAAQTGVHDAVFAHNGLFICGARSYEGALRLAELALAS